MNLVENMNQVKTLTRFFCLSWFVDNYTITKTNDDTTQRCSTEGE